jgi:hypothetical protein
MYSILAESPGMRPSKEAYRRDGGALVLDAVEVHGRGSASSIVVGASYNRPARGACGGRVSNWTCRLACLACQREGRKGNLKADIIRTCLAISR